MNPAFAAADASEEQEKNISGVVADFAAVLWIRCWEVTGAAAWETYSNVGLSLRHDVDGVTT